MEYEILTEKKKLKIQFTKTEFGYFYLTRSVIGIRPYNVGWLTLSLLFALRFFIMLIPALILDIILGLAIYLTINILNFIFEITKYLLKEGISASLKLITKLSVKIFFILSTIIMVFSIYYNSKFWHDIVDNIIFFVQTNIN